MIRHTNAHFEILAVVMTTRKGRTLDYRNNQKVNGKGSEEYDLVQYYGDETFLKIDTFENQRNILQARISGLEWRNKAFHSIYLSVFPREVMQRIGDAGSDAPILAGTIVGYIFLLFLSFSIQFRLLNS